MARVKFTVEFDLVQNEGETEEEAFNATSAECASLLDHEDPSLNYSVELLP